MWIRAGGMVKLGSGWDGAVEIADQRSDQRRTTVMGNGGAGQWGNVDQDNRKGRNREVENGDASQWGRCN